MTVPSVVPRATVPHSVARAPVSGEDDRGYWAISSSSTSKISVELYPSVGSGGFIP